MSESEKEKGNINWCVKKLKEKDSIINGISDAIALLDAKTYEILAVNQAFLDRYEMSRDSVLGKKCYQVTHHLNTPCHEAEIPCPCPVDEIVRTGERSRVEHIHKDSSNEDLYLEITVYPITDDGGRVTQVIHVCKDVTSQKMLENEIREKEKLDGILELAGAASHEINQPLTVVITGMEQLLKSMEKGGTQYKMAEIVMKNAQRLVEVSKKLSLITRYASKEYLMGKNIIDLDEASRKTP